MRLEDEALRAWCWGIGRGLRQCVRRNGRVCGTVEDGTIGGCEGDVVSDGCTMKASKGQ